MILIPVIALVVGILIGLMLNEPLGGTFGVYVAVACLAGLDTICGGIRSNLEGRFDSMIMVTGFFANVLFAFALSWLGDRIGINIFLVCAFIFGQRIFNNLGFIRRILLTRWQDLQERRRQARSAESQAASENLNPL